MRVRSPFRSRWHRICLVSALIPSLYISSSAGQALVLHQHGERYAHLHVLSARDLQSGAALSAKFGHRPLTCALDATGESARVLAIVATGSTFVSHHLDDGDGKLFAPQFAAAIDFSPHLQLAGLDSSLRIPLASDGETLSAVTRLRIHTILI